MCPSPHFLPSYFQIRVKTLPPHWISQETWVSDTSIIMWPSTFCGDCSTISQACCVNEDTIKFFSKLCLLSESFCCFQKCDRNSGCRFCPMVHTKLGQIILCLSHTNTEAKSYLVAMFCFWLGMAGSWEYEGNWDITKAYTWCIEADWQCCAQQAQATWPI